MRHLVGDNGATLAAFLLFLLVFAFFAGTFGPGHAPLGQSSLSGPATGLALPSRAEDADRDSYPDAVDPWPGDLVVALDVTRLRAPGETRARPYLLVGSQDDQWRTGAGREMAWRHVYDHDPFGHQPGSPEWIGSALRTGAWWRSQPIEGETHAIARSGTIDEAAPGTTWPQRFFINVRDDRAQVEVLVELWDAAPRPAALRDAWTLQVDVAQGAWRADSDAPWLAVNESAVVGSLSAGATGLELTLRLTADLDADTKAAIAARWAPRLHFAADATFYPTRADAFEQFHGFWHREPDYRTWTRGFNNGRDAYRLLLADFTGDGVTDHRDAVIMTDIFRAGGVAPDTVYAHVTRTTGGHIAVQYWMLYFYNFVPDETGRDIAALAHGGDREFIQLVFEDLQAAQNGTPLRVAFSQHYGGVAIEPVPGAPPFHVDPDRPSVFVALGSHASYPAAGTDEALRSALAGFGDVFPGDGDTWTPDEYDLEVLDAQRWHAGYLWGPATRHSRDLGSALQPLLQHGFAYPFLDPLHWDSTLPRLDAERLAELYGGSS